MVRTSMKESLGCDSDLEHEKGGSEQRKKEGVKREDQARYLG